MNMLIGHQHLSDTGSGNRAMTINCVDTDRNMVTSLKHRYEKQICCEPTLGIVREIFCVALRILRSVRSK
jgi:hypothetical protein